MAMPCKLRRFRELIVTGVALSSGPDLLAVSLNIKPITQPGGEPDEGQGVS